MHKARKDEMKARKVSGGYAIKRKARVEHECNYCGHYIDPGEEFYQLSLQHYHYGYYTKPICEICWKGRELKA